MQYYWRPVTEKTAFPRQILFSSLNPTFKQAQCLTSFSQDFKIKGSILYRKLILTSAAKRFLHVAFKSFSVFQCSDKTVTTRGQLMLLNVGHTHTVRAGHQSERWTRSRQQQKNASVKKHQMLKGQHRDILKKIIRTGFYFSLVVVCCQSMFHRVQVKRVAAHVHLL